jgi:RNA polymerase sigma-70 factor, ECF subfamily
MSSAERSDSTSTATSSALLEGLKSPEGHGAWDSFVHRYRPLLVRYACRLGLGQEDAQDAAQQILMAFCTAYRDGRYQRDRGRLRDWLFGIARHQVINFRQRRPHKEVQVPEASGQSGFFAKVPADDDLEAMWEQEWRQTILQECIRLIRQEFDARTVDAFELFAREGLPAKEVAERLQLTANAVFLAKRRVLARIRELLAHLEESW